MSNAAEDEYNALIARNTARHTRHREDISSASENESDDPSQTKQTATSTLRSIRPSNLRAPNSSDDSDDDFEDRYGGYTAKSSSKAANVTIPNAARVGRGQTGAKGVITDARDAEKELGAQKQKSTQKANATSTSAQDSPEIPWHHQATSTDGTDLEDLEDEDSQEDEYVRKWRESRMQELGHQKRRRYGTVEVVDAMGYLDAIDTAPKGTTVVVYIYDDELSLSRAYKSHVNTIASKYSNIHFIALHHEDAEMESAGVPAILAYRGGEKFADMVPLMDEVPFTCNVVTNLEEALKRNGII